MSNNIWKVCTGCLLMLLVTSVQAQYGPVGFVNYNDGINGITGGMGGNIVRVTNRTDLATYAGSATPYIIVVEGKMEGKGLSRTKDLITVNSNKTIVGVKGAELAGIGLDINGKQNIIIRNLIIHHADPDAIAARNSHHIWIDHCDVYSQDEADKEDWDGLIDLTVGSSYLTVSYCYIHDHHKACLLNSGTMHYEDNGKNRATYHHNYFTRTDQRNPRIGYGLGHVFSNLYKNISSYAIGVHTQAQVMSECNYFDSTVKNAFEQMYAGSLDDASCGFYADHDSFFGKTPATDFKHKQTGTNFNPSWWYDYDFALQQPGNIQSLSSEVGPVENLENEPVLWPGNGATNLPTDIQLAYSHIENMTGAEVFLGTSKDALSLVDPSLLTLQPATTYYWYVREQTKDKNFSSPVYQFTTASSKATNPTPADGEQHAQLRVATSESAKTGTMPLMWRPAAEAKSYQVYLSTSRTELDSHLLATVTTTHCQPEVLSYGETYYWRVDALRQDGSTIQGDVWSFTAPAKMMKAGRTEMEHLVRSAYSYLEREDGAWFKASNDSVTVGEAGPGAMTGVWNGDDGNYRVSIDFYDEKAGQAWMGLSVNNILVDQWTGVRQYAMTTHQVEKEVPLRKGDQIRIDFYTQSKMRCRIDYIDIMSSASAISSLHHYEVPSHDAVIYDLQGRRMSLPLKPGIYVINHRKVVIK